MKERTTQFQCQRQNDNEEKVLPICRLTDFLNSFKGTKEVANIEESI